MQETQIIFEDDDFVAVNKPAGLLTHPAQKSEEPTLADWLVEKYPQMRNVGDEPGLRPGIVHRLDKETSGVIIAAKNQQAFEFLKEQFKNRKIKKKYIVLAHGKLKYEEGKDIGIIDLPIGKSKKDFRRRAAKGELAGIARDAITEYKIKEIFPEYTLIEAYPKTGRTHQIRVHFREIGHPVVCDALYGFKNLKCPTELGRQFLHANYLEFILPSGAIMRLEADLPDDLNDFLGILRRNA